MIACSNPSQPPSPPAQTHAHTLPFPCATLPFDFSRPPHRFFVSTFYSYTFAEHERRVGQLAEEMGFTHVSLSSEVMPMVKAVPRGFTTAADAYLTPVIKRYVKSFRSGFDQVSAGDGGGGGSGGGGGGGGAGSGFWVAHASCSVRVVVQESGQPPISISKT